MINFPVKLTFWLLIAVFILILLGIFVPWVGTTLFNLGGATIVFAEWIVFSILGAILVFLVFKNKISGKLKINLLLVGFSALGFFIFVLLHNLISGLLSIAFNAEIEEPVFFILATLVSPIVFLNGAIWSIFFFNKKKISSPRTNP